LPPTSTFDGADSMALLPSKMRTFWNRTLDMGGDWASAETAKPRAAEDKSDGA
jgi:hypothetical protein